MVCCSFVIAFDWVAEEANRLTPCIAFRDEGVYHVQVRI